MRIHVDTTVLDCERPKHNIIDNLHIRRPSAATLHGHSYGLHYASCLFVCPALCLCHKQSGIDEP